MIKCPLCDTVYYPSHTEKLEIISFYKCKTCGLEFSPYMKSSYDYSEEETHWRSEIKLVEYAIKEHLKFKDKIVILEVGAGDLRHLIYLRKKFGNKLILYAYDLAYKNLVMEKAKKYNISLLSFTSLEAQKYDVIFMFHVLEHLESPKEFMVKLKNCLVYGGSLILSVPNDRRITRKIFKESFDYPPYHLTRWNKEALENLANIVGLKLSYIWRENFNIRNFYLLRLNIISSIYSIYNIFRRQFTPASFVNNRNGDKIKESKNITVFKQTLKILLKHIASIIAILFFPVLFILGKEKGLSLSAGYIKTFDTQKKILVSDFDYTIICSDSFSDILDLITKKSKLKRLILIVLRTLFNLNIINNTVFKKFCVKFFFLKFNKKDLEMISAYVADTYIKQNKINLNLLNKLIENMNAYENFIVISSASPTVIVENIIFRIIEKLYPEYLEKFKTSITILGSTIKYKNNNRIKSLSENNYHLKKKENLLLLGVEKIKTLYTDSLTDDKPLIDISDEVFLVKKTGMIRVK